MLNSIAASTRLAVFLILTLVATLISAEEPAPPQITARQVLNPAGGAGAAGGQGGIPTNVAPTTITITSTDAAGKPVTIYSLYSASQKPITSVQFAQPQAGTIGMGTLTGQIGVVRTQSANSGAGAMGMRRRGNTDGEIGRSFALMGVVQGLAAFMLGLFLV